MIYSRSKIRISWDQAYVTNSLGFFNIKLVRRTSIIICQVMYVTLRFIYVLNTPFKFFKTIPAKDENLNYTLPFHIAIKAHDIMMAALAGLLKKY